MKCLIFSDSHGNIRNMREALLRNPDVDVVFFLGDGLYDADTVSFGDLTRAWLAVAGNCDIDRTFRGTHAVKTDAINLEGHRIVFTHGDIYGAKYGLGGLIRLAGEQAASVVLFGHTHTPCETYENGVYLFTPGSISSGSFGVMTITASGILLSHGKL